MAMAGGLVPSWLGADDLADDGAMNGSISRQPASVQNYDVDQTPQPGSGDVCVHNNNFPCPGGVIGFQGSYPYTVATYDDSAGCDVLEAVGHPRHGARASGCAWRRSLHRSART